MIVRSFSNSESPRNVLIALHGWTGNISSMEPVANAWGIDDLKWVLVQAPYIATDGGFTWFDGNEDIGIVEMDEGGNQYSKDLALILVKGKEGLALPLKKDITNIGEEVLAIGAPQGLGFSFTKGIVSSIREDEKFIQTDTAINPGNSGGPLIDRQGCVVGVNTFGLTDSEGLNFAISSPLVKRFIEKSNLSTNSFKYQGKHLNVKDIIKTNTTDPGLKIP